MLTGVDGLYMSLFVGLPLTNFLYRKLKHEKKANKKIDYKGVIKNADDVEEE